MPVEITSRRPFFRTKEIWFSDQPYDVNNCWRVIFRHCRNKVCLPDFEIHTSTTLVVNLSRDLDDIWNDMGSKSTRYKINRAIREDVKVKVSQDYDLFYRLNRAFRRKRGLPTKMLSLYQLKKHGTLLLAAWHGEVIAGQLYIEDPATIRYVLGASGRLEVDRRQASLIGFGNRLLIWEAMRYAKGKGIAEFDLGGYYTGSDKHDPRHGINRFKKGFGGRLVTRYNYTKYYSPAYNFLRSFLSLHLTDT